MMRHVIGLGALALALSAGAQASAAVTISNLGGGINPEVRVDAPGEQIDAHPQTWSGAPPASALSGSAGLNVSNDQGFANLAANVSATWAASGQSGTAHFDDSMDFAAAPGASFGVYVDFGLFDVPGVSYTFTANQTFGFTIDYNVATATPINGGGNEQGYGVLVDGSFIGGLLGAGTFQFNLTGGVAHTVAFSNFTNVSTIATDEINESQSGDLSWSIGERNSGPLIGGAAPEPAEWALMLLGLGLAGAGLRRRPVVA